MMLKEIIKIGADRSIYDRGIMAVGNYKNRKNVDLASLRKSIKNGVKSEAHYRMGFYGKDDGCIMPFTVIDVDADTPTESYEIARRHVLALRYYGVEPFVFYTGGRGFHVFFESEYYGLPVFKRDKLIGKVMTTFLSRILDDEYDKNLLYPKHMCRLPNSVRYGKELPVYDAADFLRLGTSTIRFGRNEFSFDRDVVPSKALVDEFIKSVSSIQPTQSVRHYLSVHAVIEKILYGIGESEHFGEKWDLPYMGRDYALFLLSQYVTKSKSNFSKCCALYGKKFNTPRELILYWDNFNKPPLGKFYIDKKLKYYERKYGCQF